MQLLLMGSGLDSMAQLLTVFIIFVFVLAITYFATRWVGNLQKERMDGSNVKILETMRISNSKYIQIVKIGNRCFAMAVCKETVTYLCDVDEEDLVYNDASAKKFNVDNFKAILEKYKKDKPED
jgi:flagellar protein FliO/FliZ